jgi:hypothetical protein
MSWLFEFDPMFHAPTKNIEVDFEFIKEKDTHCSAPDFNSLIFDIFI